MAGAPLAQRGEARRPRLRRQHGRLCARLRARRRGGARRRGAAARRLAARADGRAGAHRQPSRRHRRHLQRRLLLADARPLRHPARARAARRRRLLRPSADDGPHRAGRRRRRPRRRTASADLRALLGDDPARAFPTLVELYDNTASLQDRTVGDRHPRRRAGAAVRRRRLRRPRLRPRLRRAPRARLRALRRSSPSTCRCCTEGDVNARVWVRIREVEQSLSLIEQILDRLPGGAAARRAAERRRGARRHGAGRRLPRRRPGLAAARRRRPRSRAATCAIRPGSSGRCSKPRSRATSSPTSRSATNRFNCSYSGHDL